MGKSSISAIEPHRCNTLLILEGKEAAVPPSEIPTNPTSPAWYPLESIVPGTKNIDILDLPDRNVVADMIAVSVIPQTKGK